MNKKDSSLKKTEKEKAVEEYYNTVLKTIIFPLLGKTTTMASQLDTVGKRLFKNKWSGVYASDTIPVLSVSRCYCIANLDSSNQSGSHWVAIVYFNGKYHVYDSFGRSTKIILKSFFLKNKGKILDSDDDREQGFSQTSCGQRSVCWIYAFHEIGDLALLI